MFGLMNKLTGTRVPTIVGIYYHFTVVLVPVDINSKSQCFKLPGQQTALRVGDWLNVLLQKIDQTDCIAGNAYRVTNTPFPCPFLVKPHTCLFILLLFQLKQKYNK